MTDRPAQVTLRELLKDPIYREWLKKVPKLMRSPLGKPRWRVYVQKDLGGGWGKRDFFKYSEAYAFVKSRIDMYNDLVIHSQVTTFAPPTVVKKTKSGDRVRRYYVPPVAQDSDVINEQHKHHWCGLCRRPTLFLTYSKHHALPGLTLSSADRRCCVCGVRLDFLKRY